MLTTTLAQATGSSWIHFDFHALVDQFGNSTRDGLTWGAIYALIALGYTLVYGVLNLINFAHSEVFIAGAYAVFFTLSALGFNGSNPTIPIWMVVLDLILAALAAMAVSAVVAVVLERVAYRPLRRRGAPRLVFLISAIGASFTMQYLIFVWRGPNPERSLKLFKPVPVFDLGGTIIDSRQLTIVISAIVVMVLVERLIATTRLGRGIRAVAQDPDTATLMGVNKERIIVTTFALGGVIAGVGALFMVMLSPNSVQYNGGFLPGIKAFAAAVLGGIGNIRGALLGGLLLGLISIYGQVVLGSGEWADVVAFVVLVLVLLVRPNGILGSSLGRSRA